jgi:hypothetical protein
MTDEMRNALDRGVELQEEWDQARTALKGDPDNYRLINVFRDTEARLRAIKTKIADLLLEDWA